MTFQGTESYSLARRDDAAKQEFWACLALRECPGFGMRRISLLLHHFGSAYEAVRNPAAWHEAGVPVTCVEAFKKETWRQKAGLEWAAAKAFPCGIVFWSDKEYPDCLRAIPDAPPFLYFIGDLTLLQNPAVAVVGMRSCSDEGIKTTIDIAGGLAKAGLTVVSGMARGIDRVAHLAAVECVGRSIGVLGAGIDVEYPAGNKDLYALMRKNGLIISELHPGFGVDGRCFPVRNRIISGLSRAVVVVEAALRSGSINTANHALEQNREVMTVPGPTSALTSKGCQELVRRGAKAVFTAEDVLRELVDILKKPVAEAVLARDLARFRKRGPGKKKSGKDKAVQAELEISPAETVPEASLPWRAAPERKHAVSGARSTVFPAPPVAEAAASPGAVDEPAPIPDSAAAGLTGLEADVYDLVRQGPIHIDDICRSLGQNAKVISSVTAMLEVRGKVQRLPGMVYAARR